MKESTTWFIILFVLYAVIFTFGDYMIMHTHEYIHVAVANNYNYNVTEIEVNFFWKQSYIAQEPTANSIYPEDYIRLQTLNEIIGYYITTLFRVIIIILWLRATYTVPRH